MSIFIWAPVPDDCLVSCSTVANLTAQTAYEISAWAKTDLGDSPLAFAHVTTKGIRPPAPSLKAKATNQTAVECTWTGPRNVVGWRCVLALHKGSPGHGQLVSMP